MQPPPQYVNQYVQEAPQNMRMPPGFQSNFENTQMVQAQYFTPGLYSPEQAPQPIYDMPAKFIPMAPQPQPMIAVSRPQGSTQMQAGNPAWDDFNKRRNAAIRTQGFTTKESAKAPVDTMAPGGKQLSQDATNAYLQSIGVSPGGGGSAPQYVSAPQYAPVYAGQSPVYAQPPVQEVQYLPVDAYTPSKPMPAMQPYELHPAPPAMQPYELHPAPMLYEPLAPAAQMPGLQPMPGYQQYDMPAYQQYDMTAYQAPQTILKQPMPGYQAYDQPGPGYQAYSPQHSAMPPQEQKPSPNTNTMEM